MANVIFHRTWDKKLRRQNHSAEVETEIETEEAVEEEEIEEVVEEEEGKKENQNKINHQ